MNSQGGTIPTREALIDSCRRAWLSQSGNPAAAPTEEGFFGVSPEMLIDWEACQMGFAITDTEAIHSGAPPRSARNESRLRWTSDLLVFGVRCGDRPFRIGHWLASICDQWLSDVIEVLEEPQDPGAIDLWEDALVVSIVALKLERGSPEALFSPHEIAAAMNRLYLCCAIEQLRRLARVAVEGFLGIIHDAPIAVLKPERFDHI